MNILKSKIFLFIFTAILTSCNDSDDITLNENDYLIFGHYYGHCVGESCVETYKLTKDNLFEDKTDSYAGIEPFNFIELSNDQFKEVKDLIDFLPNEILNEKESTFGCPDCADQGGILIIFSKDGQTKMWKFDQSKNDVPKYLHSFLDKVNNAISIINQ